MIAEKMNPDGTMSYALTIALHESDYVSDFESCGLGSEFAYLAIVDALTALEDQLEDEVRDSIAYYTSLAVA